MQSLRVCLFVAALLLGSALCSDSAGPQSRQLQNVAYKENGSTLSFTSVANDPASKHKDQYTFQYWTSKTGKDVYTVSWVFDSHIGAKKERYEVDYAFDFIAEYNVTDTTDGRFPGINSDKDCTGACLQISTGVDKKTVKSYNASSHDDTLHKYVFTGDLTGVTGASVEITIHVSTAPVEFDPNRTDAYFSPNLVKTDVRVVNWPYLTVADPTRLAFGLSVMSKSKVKNEGESTQTSRLNLGDGGETGAVFGWANKVTLCGEETAIDLPVSDLPEDGKDSLGNGYNLYFSVMSDTKVSCLLWDPVVGTTYSDEFCIGSLCGAGAYAAVVFVVLACIAVLIAAVLYVMMKRSSTNPEVYSNF